MLFSVLKRVIGEIGRKCLPKAVALTAKEGTCVPQQQRRAPKPPLPILVKLSPRPSLLRSSEVEYKYIVRLADGSVKWQKGENTHLKVGPMPWGPYIFGSRIQGVVACVLVCAWHVR